MRGVREQLYLSLVFGPFQNVQQCFDVAVRAKQPNQLVLEHLRLQVPQANT